MNEMTAQAQRQPQRVAFSQLINSAGYQRTIANTLTDPGRVRRFTAAITSAVSVNPTLQECEPSTILSAALLGESLNLSPSPQLGAYYLVPFENKKKGCKEAQFVLGYKGLLQLAMRSGQYKHINVLDVKQGELISWNPLTEEVAFSPIVDDTLRDATPTVGYIASFELLNGFRKTIYWSKEKMINHADKFSPAFSRDAVNTPRFQKVSFADYEAGNYPKGDEWKYSSFWYRDFSQMSRKTMIRQLIGKWGIMSVDMQTAMEADTDVDPGAAVQAVQETFQPPTSTPVAFTPAPAVEVQHEPLGEPTEGQASMALDDL